MPTISELERAYVATHPTSQQLFERAQHCFASGVTHDARFARPFPIYIARARGGKKWDVDGNEYVDYVMGHGTLVLGYGDERVVAAFHEQVPKALHMGSCTELEIEWAELIQQLVPVARNGFVRATACGSEAVALGVRLARCYTNRSKIVVQGGSYHGTADATLLAYRGPPYGLYNVRGIPARVREDVAIVPFNNLPAVEEQLATGDVACVLLHCNNLYTKAYVEGLRRLTTRYGAVFLMDEVISGFRYAAGGAQEYYGVTPDLATLGKVPGGGAPIGVICGRREILDYFAFKDEYWNRFVRIASGGTWNAQPLCIVGGVATMKIILAERDALYPRLYRAGARLVKSFNDQAADLGVAALATGLPPEHPTILDISLFNRPIPAEQRYLWQTGPTTFADEEVKASFTAGGQAPYATHLAMVNNGVNAFRGTHFFTCAAYTAEDLETTEAAFGHTLRALKENQLVATVP